MKKLPVTIRTLQASDLSFIFSSWLKSYRSSYFAMKVANEIYFKEHQKIIERCIAKGEIKVAVNQEDHDQILGFVCFEPHLFRGILTLHYIYVKSPYRKLGVGKELLEDALYEASHDRNLPIVTTHTSKLFDGFVFTAYAYNPYLMKGEA